MDDGDHGNESFDMTDMSSCETDPVISQANNKLNNKDRNGKDQYNQQTKPLITSPSLSSPPVTRKTVGDTHSTDKMHNDRVNGRKRDKIGGCEVGENKGKERRSKSKGDSNANDVDNHSGADADDDHDDHEPLILQILSVGRNRRAVLILVVMIVHSFAEGK